MTLNKEIVQEIENIVGNHTPPYFPYSELELRQSIIGEIRRRFKDDT